MINHFLRLHVPECWVTTKIWVTLTSIPTVDEQTNQDVKDFQILLELAVMEDLSSTLRKVFVPKMDSWPWNVRVGMIIKTKIVIKTQYEWVRAFQKQPGEHIFLKLAVDQLVLRGTLSYFFKNVCNHIDLDFYTLKYIKNKAVFAS